MANATGTRQKALALNLDAKSYGTFAEIGAGQEVARWFFSAGGAAGTVAKTTSAYDMAVSHELYGSTTRYVSRQRLEAMLEHEFVKLRNGLEATCAPYCWRSVVSNRFVVTTSLTCRFARPMVWPEPRMVTPPGSRWYRRGNHQGQEPLRLAAGRTTSTT